MIKPGRSGLTKVFIAYFLGMGIEFLLGPSLINGFLYLELGLPESLAYTLDLSVAAVSFIAIPFLLYQDRQNKLFRNVLRGLSVVYMLNAGLILGLSFHWSSILDASGPLLRGIIPWSLTLPLKKRHQWLKNFLVLIFLAHGLKAIFQGPSFQDYLYILPVDLSPTLTMYALLLIGIIDIALAFLLFKGKFQQATLYYMIFWGLLTALLRPYILGLYGIAPFLVRVPHWLAAYILLKKPEEKPL